MNELFGTKYCGPFNRMDKGDPVNGVDAACYEHDIEYGKDPSWWKYTPFRNSIIVKNADQKLIDKIDEMDEKGIEIGAAGRIGRMYFKAKKRVVNWGDPGHDRALPLGARIQGIHGPNPFLPQSRPQDAPMDIDSRTLIPKKGLSFRHRGRNYSIGFKSFFKFMRYKRRRLGRRYRRYKKRRYSRYNKARKLFRSRKFRSRVSAFRKAFMKGKRRHVKKGVRASRNIKKELKFASFLQAPKKYDGTCSSCFDLGSLALSATINSVALGKTAGSTGNYDPEWWIMPGWSGGKAGSAVPFQGSPLATWNTGAELNSLISAVGYTAASAVNRTFFYNYNVVHEIVNCSNYPIYMTVYRCVAKNNIASVGSPANDILTANRASYQTPFNLMQLYSSNTTLFPNAATAVSFGTAFTDATDDSTVYVSEKGFNPTRCTDLTEVYKIKKLSSFELTSMKKVILREKHRPMEYNSRTWINSAKKGVTWSYLVSFHCDTYKTSDSLFRAPWPTITMSTRLTTSILQSTLRDYVGKYIVRSSAYAGTIANCQVNQEGQADVAVD